MIASRRLILKTPGEFQLDSIEFDNSLLSDEVLLKVHRVGICGTDIHAYKGNQPFFSYPRVLGHELGVEILALGSDVKNFKEGQRCSIEPYFNRKDGQAVRNGKPNCGEHLSVFGVHEDGGMQDYIKIKEKYLHPSDQLSYEQLALVETLAIGYHAVQRSGAIEADKILIIGAGPIGLSTMEFARLAGAEVAVMDTNTSRLNFCQANKLANHAIDATAGNVEDQLREKFNGDLPTVVFDATGNPHSMMNSFAYPAHGGKLVFIGLFQGDVTFHDPTFHRKELTLLASRNALHKDFEEIIKLIESGRVGTSHWITHRASLSEVPNQFSHWVSPEAGVVKAMIEVV